MQKYDLLIVGAGMVGLTLALAIRKQTSLTVAIADTLPLSELSPQPETRVSAINSASKQLLTNIGVWPSIVQARHQAYQKMHIWDKNGFGHIDFDCADVDIAGNVEQLGWIIENNIIRQALWKLAEQDQGISFFTEQALTNLAVGESEVFASFGQQSPLIAKLVVGADGAHSWVRKQMDMPVTFKDYDHHAIVATVKTEQGHQNCAWQVFLPSGPCAFLPLYDENLVSIVWSTSPEEAQRLAQLTPELFSQELTAASDAKLGKLTLSSERFSYPLTMRMAQDFVKDRMVLVGDAAHTIHPLAGQGVNLGLLDAAALVEVIEQKLADDPNTPATHAAWANSAHLTHYNRWRKSEAAEMIAAMESIKQLFAVKQAGFKLLRGMGMSLLNRISPLKSLMIKQALGHKSHLPYLAKK